MTDNLPTAFDIMRIWSSFQLMTSMPAQPDLKTELEMEIDEFQTEVECLEDERRILKEFLSRLEQRISVIRKKANQKKTQLRRLTKRIVSKNVNNA